MKLLPAIEDHYQFEKCESRFTRDN